MSCGHAVDADPKSGLVIDNALVSLGFVIARFSVWLRELAVHREPEVQAHHAEISLPIGVAMMTLGGLLAVLAA